jgi:uncharacterized membrane protein YgdD (TMEM256/DUF423 family)
MKFTRIIFSVTAVFGFVGVAAGAFGAHALRPMLEASERVGVWETAVLYLLVHVVALLALFAGREHLGELRVNRIAVLWQLGLLLFSGSLFAICLGGPSFWGPITPLGGLLLLAGWAYLAYVPFAAAAK